MKLGDLCVKNRSKRAPAVYLIYFPPHPQDLQSDYFKINQSRSTNTNNIFCNIFAILTLRANSKASFSRQITGTSIFDWIGQLHDDIILLQLPEFFSFFFVQIRAIVLSAGLTNLSKKAKKKKKWILVVVVKCRHRENGLLPLKSCLDPRSHYSTRPKR